MFKENNTSFLEITKQFLDRHFLMVKNYLVVDLRQKVGRFSSCLLLVIMISLASFSNFQGITSVFWLSVIARFSVLSLLGMLGLFLLLTRQINIGKIGVIDLCVFVFFIYTIGNSIMKMMPNSPPEDTTFLIFMFLYYILIRFTDGDRKASQIKTMINGLVVLTVLQAFFGVLQLFGVISPYSDSYRVSGTFINPGIYACFLVIGFLVSVDQLLNCGYSKSNRRIYAFAASVALLALIYSGSRTAWLVLILGGASIYMLRDNYLSISNKRKWLLILSAGGIAAGILYLLVEMNTQSINGRFLIWKLSLPMFTNNPVTGLGDGAFFVQYGDYQAKYFLDGRGQQSEIQLASMNYYAFNEYWRILIEEGLLGFLLFFLVLLQVAVFVFRRMKYIEKQHQSFFRIIIIIGGALLSFAFFSYPAQDISITMILLCLLSWVGYFQAIGEESWNLNERVGRIINFVIGLICIGGIFISVLKMEAVLKWKSAKENILFQEGVALCNYESVLPTLSNNGLFLYNYGAELNGLGLVEKADTILKQATLYGNSVELQLKIADNFEKLGKIEDAEYSYLKAAHMNPKLFAPFNSLFDFYIRNNQKIKARELALRICNKPIKIESRKVLEIKDRACKYLEQ